MSNSTAEQNHTEDTFQNLVETLRDARTEKGLTIFQIGEALEEVLNQEERDVLIEILN